MKSIVQMLTAVIVLLTSTFTFAGQPAFTETYDITPTTCEGLKINGVAYSFSVVGTPNLDCAAGTSAGPGISGNINSPNIEGTSGGVLHLTFDVPTTKFSFGVAESIILSPQDNSVVVDMYRPGAGLLRQEVALTTTSDPYFVGGRFDYNGPAVKSATIRFSDTFTRFAIDNVTYFRPPGLVKK
jgi:hypothetical protein